MIPLEHNRPSTQPAVERDRAAALDWAQATPLAYGRDSWREFKALYKSAERGDDPELLGALIARIDALSYTVPASPIVRQEFSNVPNSFTANREFLLLEFGQWYQSQRYEAQPIPHSLPSSDFDRSLGRYASKITWLGNSLYGVSLNPASGQFAGTLNVLSFAGSGPMKQIATLAIGKPLCVAATETHAFVLVAQPSDERNVNARTQGWAHVLERIMHPRRSGYPTVLFVVDLSDPWKPTPIAALDIPNAVGMSLHGSHITIAVKTGGSSWSPGLSGGWLETIDVSQPSQPRSLGRVSVNNIHAIAATDRRVFVLTRSEWQPFQSGMTILDTSDPQHPHMSESCELPGVVLQTLSVQGDRVYALSTHPWQLHCVEYSDTGKLIRLQSVDTLPQDYNARGTLEIHGSHVYIATSSGIVTYDMTDPKHPLRLGNPPSVGTVGYMKRRARRALRALASSNPAVYVETAFAMLTAPGLQGETLDLATHWAAYDVLYGAGTRFGQARHGRGSLLVRDARLPRRPEYRAPDAWRARPDLALWLYAAQDRPWQVYDAALKMLRAARVPAPFVSSENLARFLRSESPLLIRQAARSVAELAATDASLPADLIADAWYLGTAAVRRALRPRVLAIVSEPRQSPDFAARLFERATGQNPSGAFSRRRESALLLLARQFPDTLIGRTVLPVLGTLLASGRDEITTWTLRAFSQSSTDLVPDWIAALEPVEPTLRQRALDALIAAMRGRAMDGTRARALIHADTPWKRDAGWQALQASATPNLIFHNLWAELFNAPDNSQALATALSSPAALATLERTDYTPEELLNRLQARPALARLLAPEAFAQFALSLPPRALIPLLATVSVESWQALRPGLITLLQDPARSLAFWQAAWTILPAQSDTVLQERILDDGPISDTMLRARDPEFLKTDAVVFGPLLIRWAEYHADLFARGSADLLAAATHALPEVRAWGLTHALFLGLDLPFSLRLMESELPASVRVGQQFFDAASAETILEYALVLCDSPVASVRAYGQERLTTEWGSVDQNLALERLCENPHSDMQEFLAGLLLNTASVPAGAAAFDRAVLRARGRARPAKELVKKRRSATLDPASPEDVAMLLEVARGRTPRDAEWALTRLAALALAGEEIPGVTIDGVAGI